MLAAYAFAGRRTVWRRTQRSAQIRERVFEMLGDELAHARFAPLDPGLQHFVMLGLGIHEAALRLEMLAHVASGPDRRSHSSLSMLRLTSRRSER